LLVAGAFGGGAGDDAQARFGEEFEAGSVLGRVGPLGLAWIDGLRPVAASASDADARPDGVVAAVRCRGAGWIGGR
jgi:hypothetical protein